MISDELIARYFNILDSGPRAKAADLFTLSRIGRVLFGFKKMPAGWRMSAFRPLTAFINDGLT